MVTLLEICNLPQLNHEEIENMNRPITSMETESVIKNLPTDKRLGRLRWFHWWTLPNVYRRVNTSPSQTLPKSSRGENTPKLILQGQPTLIPKPDKDTTRKEKYRPISLMKIHAEIVNKILAKWIQQHTKRIIHHDQVGFIHGMQRWFSIRKPISVIHHINRMKIKIKWSQQMPKKSFDKIQHPFMIKNSQQKPQHNKGHIWQAYS